MVLVSHDGPRFSPEVTQPPKSWVVLCPLAENRVRCSLNRTGFPTMYLNSKFWKFYVIWFNEVPALFMVLKLKIDCR